MAYLYSQVEAISKEEGAMKRYWLLSAHFVQIYTVFDYMFELYYTYTIISGAVA